MLGQINQVFVEAELDYRRERLVSAGARPSHPIAGGRLSRLGEAIRNRVAGRTAAGPADRHPARAAGLISMDRYRAVPAHGRCR
jgi:hypothetical protein